MARSGMRVRAWLNHPPIVGNRYGIDFKSEFGRDSGGGLARWIRGVREDLLKKPLSEP
jgi:hypothetical protein